jgi:formylglycine-generating enzyme required for sulfatase activity
MAPANRLKAEELPPGRAFRDCAECPEMVVVPAGSFMMGSSPAEIDALVKEFRSENFRSEGPQHRVTIAKPFTVGRFEVTFAEWDACVADGGCKHRPNDKGWGRGRRPVIDVSWHDAKEYAAWLSRKTGRIYRLLSEAEWEYAARAGTTTRYAFGDTIGKSEAQYSEEYLGSAGKTVEVGSFPANKFGLHDMHGNVAEWVEDVWHPNYEGAPTDGSVWQGGDVSRRVLRGGSWYDEPPIILRSAIRYGNHPVVRYYGIGFRLARTL